MKRDARCCGTAARLMGAGLLGLALLAAPVEFDFADHGLVGQIAAAKQGGNGGGPGSGGPGSGGPGSGGPGGSRGKSAEAGQGKGQAKGQAKGATTTGADFDVDGGNTVGGHASAKGLGQAKHGDVSGVAAHGANQGISAASLDALGDLEGNLNAAHASATAMANAAPNSMPGKIAAAIAASYSGDPALDDSGSIEADEIDDATLARELGAISNKATIDPATGEPTVDQGVVDAVKGLVDGKVSVEAVAPGDADPEAGEAEEGA